MIEEGYTQFADLPAGLDDALPTNPNGGVILGRFKGEPYDGIQLAIYGEPGMPTKTAYLTPENAHELGELLIEAADCCPDCGKLHAPVV